VNTAIKIGVRNKKYVGPTNNNLLAKEGNAMNHGVGCFESELGELATVIIYGYSCIKHEDVQFCSKRLLHISQ
jgi:hypothetical protein